MVFTRLLLFIRPSIFGTIKRFVEIIYSVSSLDFEFSSVLAFQSAFFFSIRTQRSTSVEYFWTLIRRTGSRRKREMKCDFAYAVHVSISTHFRPRNISMNLQLVPISHSLIRYPHLTTNNDNNLSTKNDRGGFAPISPSSLTDSVHMGLHQFVLNWNSNELIAHMNIEQAFAFTACLNCINGNNNNNI